MRRRRRKSPRGRARRSSARWPISTRCATCEGGHLRADLDERRTLVADLVERIAVAADEGRAAVEERLRERVRQLREELQADESGGRAGNRAQRLHDPTSAKSSRDSAHMCRIG